MTIGGGDNGGDLTFNISNNTFRDAVGHAVLIVKSTNGVAPIGTGNFVGTFANNAIGVAAVADSGSLEGSDLKVQHAGDGTLTIAITGNQLRQYNNDAMLLQTGAGVARGGNFNATVTGNTIANPGNNPNVGIIMQGINLNGGVTPGDSFQICTGIGGAGGLANTLTGAGANGGSSFRLRQRQSTTVRLPGYGGGATDAAAVVTFVSGNNAVDGVPTAAVNSPPGGGFVGGTACAVP